MNHPLPVVPVVLGAGLLTAQLRRQAVHLDD